MSAAKKAVISIVVIIAIVAVALIGVYVAARVKLGIDLFSTAKQLNSLKKEVNESEAFPASFDAQDIVDLKAQTDEQLGAVVLYEKGKGYEGYSVDFEKLALSGATANPMFLSEQMTGALAQIVFYQQTGGKLTVGDKEISVCVLQTAFEEIDNESGSADLSTTVKLDLSPFKSGMDKFPYKMFREAVPDYLYVTSVVRVEKTGEGMDYTVTSKELKFNNLSGEDTADFFHTLDAVLKIGSAEDLNLKIGSTAVNALIGTKENPGFVYVLKATAGSGSFGFVTFENDGKQIKALVF